MKAGKGARVAPGTVRIIGGRWRRYRIALAGGTALRPTPDRVRETLFNWLEPHLAGARCLDLFAGSGALGFEALSRGAEHVVMVERDPAVVDALSRTSRELDAATAVIRSDALSYLRRPSAQPFDIVFVDPPYAEPVDSVLLELLPRLAGSARVYVERSIEQGLPEIASYSWSHGSRAGSVCFGLAIPGYAVDSNGHDAAP